MATAADVFRAIGMNEIMQHQLVLSTRTVCHYQRFPEMGTVLGSWRWTPVEAKRSLGCANLQKELPLVGYLNEVCQLQGNA